MKSLDRYIFREVLTYFLISLTAFTAILLTIKLIQLTSLIVNKGLMFSQIATIFIAIIPTFLELAIPMSALLGVMLAFARLSGDSEIIVMRASGISLFALSKSIFVFGILVSLVSFFVSIYLSPWGNKTLGNVLYEIARSKSTSGLDEGMFNKLGKLTVYSEIINHKNGDLEKVIIQDDRADIERLIISTSGKIISDDEKQLIIIRLNNGEIHEANKKDYVITHFNKNQIIIAADQIYDPDAKMKGKDTKKMSILELKREKDGYLKALDIYKEKKKIKNDRDIAKDDMISLTSMHEDNIKDFVKNDEQEITFKELTKRIANIELDGGKRFSVPIACLILALIAMPLGIQPPRAQKAWGAGISSLLGLGVFIIYFGILSIGMALCEKGSLGAFVALWTPNLVIGIFAAILLQKMNSEKWQSTAHFIESIVKFFKKFNIKKTQKENMA